MCVLWYRVSAADNYLTFFRRFTHAIKSGLPCACNKRYWIADHMILYY